MEVEQPVPPPPARFCAEAKEKWAETPGAVRTEIVRMERELTKGFEQCRDAAKRDASLAEFHALAAKGGRDLKDVIAAYVNMEGVLRTDPVGGIFLVCDNLGIDPIEVFRECLARAA